MSLYEDWQDALVKVNLKPLSDDKCCRLLAILYVFGGGREEFVVNKRLVADIKYAQKRLNLFGSETPNIELLPTLQNYITDLIPRKNGNENWQERDTTNPVKWKQPLKYPILKNWVNETMADYNIAIKNIE